MKKITIEEAERSPKRLGIKFRHDFHLKDHDVKYHYWYMHEDKFTYGWVWKFISKYLGKSWDVCYSDFIHKVKQERCLNHSIQLTEMRDWFKKNFGSNPHQHWCHSRYIIDADGLVQRNPKYTDTRRHRHKLSLYKIEPNQSIRAIFKRYNLLESYYKLLEGITNKEVDDLFTKSYLCNGLLHALCEHFKTSYKTVWSLKQYFIHFYEVIEKTPNEWKKEHYENRAAERKAFRDAKRYNKERWDESLHTIFWRADRAREERIKAQKEAEKKEQELNIITRDRLGFDGTSFKIFR